LLLGKYGRIPKYFLKIMHNAEQFPLYVYLNFAP